MEGGLPIKPSIADKLKITPLAPNPPGAGGMPSRGSFINSMVPGASSGFREESDYPIAPVGIPPAFISTDSGPMASRMNPMAIPSAAIPNQAPSSLIPLDERFDEPTGGFTGLEKFLSFGKRATENSSEAIMRRLEIAKRQFPGATVVKHGGVMDPLTGHYIPESYFLDTSVAPRQSDFISNDAGPMVANPFSVIPQSELLRLQPPPSAFTVPDMALPAYR
jgi:hypothetical protein